jgi:hypothetical protein
MHLFDAKARKKCGMVLAIHWTYTHIDRRYLFKSFNSLLDKERPGTTLWVTRLTLWP